MAENPETSKAFAVVHKFFLFINQRIASNHQMEVLLVNRVYNDISL